MVLVGLSLVVVSLSFLLYRHPPQTWPWRSWPTPSFLQIGPLRRTKAAAPDSPSSQSDNSIPNVELSPPSSSPDDDIKPPTSEQQSKPSTPSPAVPSLAPTIPLVTPPSAPVESNPISAPSRALPATEPTPPDRSPAPPRAPPRLAPLPNTPSSLMPPPPRPAPGRRLPPPTSSLSPPKTASLAPLPTGYTPLPSSSTSSSSGGKKSKKIVLPPGHSPLDWAALQPSLTPRTPFLRVTPSELKRCNGRKGRDAWTVLGGRVYDLGPYRKFHPGGEGELLRAAGREGGVLFDEVHPWVNWEGMLAGCLVGIAVGEGDGDGEGGRGGKGGGLEEMD